MTQREHEEWMAEHQKRMQQMTGEHHLMMQMK